MRLSAWLRPDPLGELYSLKVPSRYKLNETARREREGFRIVGRGVKGGKRRT